MYEKINELCQKSGITIAELERNLQFGNRTIAKWQRSSPSVKKLKRVADYFGVSIEYLIDDESEQSKRI